MERGTEAVVDGFKNRLSTLSQYGTSSVELTVMLELEPHSAHGLINVNAYNARLSLHEIGYERRLQLFFHVFVVVPVEVGKPAGKIVFLRLKYEFEAVFRA